MRIRYMLALAVLLPLVAVGALTLYRRLSRTGRSFLLGTVALLLVGAFVARAVWRTSPPFEQGLREALTVMPVGAANDRSRADAPHLGNCPAFPADNVWNTPVNGLPVDKHSSDYIGSIGDAVGLHPDFGANLENGIPYSFLPRNTRRVRVDFDYRDESDLGNYPIPPDAPVEGGSDHHVLLIDQQRCLLYELYNASRNADGSWHAGSGVKVDLTDNALRAEGKTSADAAGLTILSGLIRFDEVQAGTINHALRFTIPHTQSQYVWPARHRASSNASPALPPLGTRLRLRGDYDVSRFSAMNQVILKALKKYGMFLADNGGGIFLSGVPDKRWDDDDLHKLKAVTAKDFEAVDESDLQMLADSGRVDPTVPLHSKE